MRVTPAARKVDALMHVFGVLLVPAQAAALIEAANPLPGAEITLEANPDVVTPETLRGFRAAGVTRISFGVQSADDAQLRRLGRTHTAAA